MRWSLMRSGRLKNVGATTIGVMGLVLTTSGCGHRVIDPGSISQAPAGRVTTSEVAVGELPSVPVADVIRLPDRQRTDQYHQVKPGETLSEIARRHNTSAQRLIEANGLDPSPTIQPGQLIYIPNSGSAN